LDFSFHPGSPPQAIFSPRLQMDTRSSAAGIFYFFR